MRLEVQIGKHLSEAMSYTQNALICNLDVNYGTHKLPGGSTL